MPVRAALPVHLLVPSGQQPSVSPIPKIYYTILYHACRAQHRQRNQDSVKEVAAECADLHSNPDYLTLYVLLHCHSPWHAVSWKCLSTAVRAPPIRDATCRQYSKGRHAHPRPSSDLLHAPHAPTALWQNNCQAMLQSGLHPQTTLFSRTHRRPPGVRCEVPRTSRPGWGRCTHNTRMTLQPTPRCSSDSNRLQIGSLFLSSLPVSSLLVGSWARHTGLCCAGIADNRVHHQAMSAGCSCSCLVVAVV